MTAPKRAAAVLLGAIVVAAALTGCTAETCPKPTSSTTPTGTANPLSNFDDPVIVPHEEPVDEGGTHSGTTDEGDTSTSKGAKTTYVWWRQHPSSACK